MTISCATVPPAMEADRTRDYPGSANVFQAGTLTLAGLNAQIIQSDAAGGILVGRQNLGGEMLAGEPLFATYRLTLIGNDPIRATLHISVARGDGSYQQEGYQPAYLDFWKRLEQNL